MAVHFFLHFVLCAIAICYAAEKIIEKLQEEIRDDALQEINKYVAAQSGDYLTASIRRPLGYLLSIAGLCIAKEIAEYLVEKFKGYVWAPVRENVVAPIGIQLYYLLCYKSNIEGFRTQMENLEKTKDEVQGLVDAAEMKDEVILQNVREWLTNVNKIIVESRNIFEDELQLNLKLYCQRSRYAKEKTADVDKLTQERNSFNRVSTYALVVESRKSIFEKIMEAVKDDGINMIGIYGMGGVGKTTLAEAVGKQAEDDNLFDKVVMSVVSQLPSVIKIQGEIAALLDLKLDAVNELGRAGMLSKRLKGIKKILIILDDVWTGFELADIGIPFGEEHRGCKILLTSRSQKVCNYCNLMNSTTQKNFSIEVLSDEEGWTLFRKMAGDSVDSPDLHDLPFMVAKECAGLPLAIVTVARALRKKSVEVWRDALNKLRMIPYKEVFSSLESSYSALEDDEAKSFFLLCCLFPEDSHIPIESLMMYGMGCRLFENVRTVDQARDRAYALADSLKSSCLLQEGRSKEFVKMHDVIRDVAISIASKIEQAFLVRAGAGWKEDLQEDAFKRSAVISVLSDDIDELPVELECPKLQILLLRGTRSSLQFPDNLSLRMENLKVLNIFSIKFLSLPKSFENLKNLRTLCLNNCSLKDISIMGELKKLEIISLRNSDIEKLPKEIGMLTQLKLLDLTGCRKLTVIPSDVIQGLIQLEGLYMDGSFDKWEIEREDKERSNASLAELKHLSYLINLEIQIPHADHFPDDLLFKSLSRFKISVGTRLVSWGERYSYSKTLKLKLNVSTALKNGVKELLKKAEHFHLLGEMKGLKSVLYDLDRDGFRDLRYLIVEECSEVEHIFNASECSELQELRLRKLPRLMNLWKDPTRHVGFRNLTVVRVEGCPGLNNLFSHSVAKQLSEVLVELEVANCKIMEEIIGKGKEAASVEVDDIVFLHLRSLRLRRLPNLRNFCSNVKGDLDTHTQEPLFDKKVAFLALEKLIIEGFSFREIWHPQLPVMSFAQLRILIMKGCHIDLNVVPFGLLQRLRNLEELFAEDCDSVEEVVEVEGFVVEEGNVTEALSQLRKLRLWKLSKLKHIMWWEKFPHRTFGFQNLSSMIIYKCHSMKSIFSPSIASSLEHLRELQIQSCKMMESIITNEREGEENCIEIIVFPQLRTLRLENLPKIISFMIYTRRCTLNWPSLKVLWILCCPAMKTFTSRFSIMQNLIINDDIFKEAPQEGNNVQYLHPLFDKKVEFPALETLEIHDVCDVNEMWHPQLPAESFFQLKALNVKGCHKVLNIVPFNFLQWLQNLEEIYVENCYSVEEVFEVEGVVVTGMLSHLRNLRLWQLPKLKHIMWWDKYPDGIFGFQNLNSMIIYKCNSLKSLLSPSIASSLVQLQEVHIQSCKMMESIIAREREGEENCIELIVFPQLHTLKLQNLPKLISFMIYTGRCTLSWPLLKVLSILRCPAMKMSISRFSNLQKLMINDDIFKEAPQEGNLHDPIYPLLAEKVAFPALEELEIDSINNLKQKWHPLLKVLNVKGYHEVLNLRSLLNLEKLSVEDYNIVEEVVEVEGPVMEEEHVIETLSQLRKLSLWELPKLKHILWWDKYPCETLGFQNLNSICIYKCNNLKSLFSPSIASSFVQLQEVEIYSCEMIKSIIAREREGEEKCIDIIVFPRLHTLKLQNLPNLISFMIYTGRCTLNWPSLKVLSIMGCPAMKKFSSRFSTQKKLMINNDILKEAPQDDDLHDPIHPVFDKKVAFPALETLQIHDVGNLIEKWHLQPTVESFYQLKVLSLKGCHKVLNLLPFNLLPRLRNLEELYAEDCDTVEEMVEVEGLVVEEGHVTETLSQLRILHLWGLAKLKHMWWDMYPLGTLGLQNLSSISIYKCHGLKCLFSSSIVSSLVQLQELQIDSCQMVEMITTRERGGEENCMEIIVFPQLHTLKLKNLPKLISFMIYTGTCPLIWPSLKVLWILGCPTIKTFISEFSNLQTLMINNEMFEEAPQEGNIYDPVQPLFDKKVTFPMLEVLKIKGLDNLKDIWHPQFLVESFHQLRILNVKRCRKLLNVVSSKLMKGLRNLQEFSVKECDSVEIIFESERLAVKDKHGKIEVIWTLSQLRKLELLGLPNLFTSKHPILQKIEMDDEECEEEPEESNSCIPIGPLFDGWVAFTNLEVLRIINIENLQEIFHSQLPDASFPRLRVLLVRECHKLLRVAVFNLLPRLKNLELLVVEECNLMEEVFKLEDPVGEGHTAISLFRLKKVELRYLPNLQIFCSGNYNFELPSLEALSLEVCPKIQTFSSGFMSTPKLYTVRLENCNQLWKGDLNNTVQHLFQEKVSGSC